MGQRKKARELVLKCLYAHESTGEPVESIANSLMDHVDLNDESMLFARRLFKMVVEMIPDLDHRISQYSRNWNLDRVAMVDKNILRISICELMKFPDIPARVSINEGVELAKKYSSQESSKFVNGILDAVFKNLEMSEAEEAS